MLEEDLTLFLHWPPTINSYYGHTKRGKSMVQYITAKGKQFRENIIESVHEQVPGLHIDERMYVEVTLYPPDRRIRDLDNYMKALLDALTHSKLWEDDSLIDQLVIHRGVQTTRGAVVIEISPAAPLIPWPDWS